MAQADDAKAERIRQLQCTLSDIIDERDELRDLVDNLSQSEQAAQLEFAQTEIQWLRSQTEGGVSERQCMQSMSAISG